MASDGINTLRLLQTLNLSRKRFSLRPLHLGGFVPYESPGEENCHGAGRNSGVLLSDPRLSEIFSSEQEFTGKSYELHRKLVKIPRLELFGTSFDTQDSGPLFGAVRRNRDSRNHIPAV